MQPENEEKNESRKRTEIVEYNVVRRTTVRFAKAIALSAKTDTLNWRDQQCKAQLLSRHFFLLRRFSVRETMHNEN